MRNREIETEIQTSKETETEMQSDPVANPEPCYEDGEEPGYHELGTAEL